MQRSTKSGEFGSEDGVSRRRIMQSLAAAGVVGLAGCSGGGDGGETTTSGGGGSTPDDSMSTDTATSTEAMQATQLKAASWGGEVEQNIVTSILNQYDKNHDDVTIKYQNTPFGEYSNKLQTQFAGNTEPDVFYLIADDAPKFMRNGALLQLDKYVKNDPNFAFDDVLDNLLEPFMYQGKVYGIPKDFTPVGLFNNTGHLEKAGASTDLATWDDLRTALETVKSKTDVEYPMAFKSKPRNTLVQLIWQNGGRVLNKAGDKAVVGSQSAIEALQFLVDLHDDGLAALYGNEISATWAGPALGKGTVTATMTGAWTVSTLQDNYSSTYENMQVSLPLPANGQKKTIMFTTSWSASSSTEAPKDAANLVKSLTSKKGMWKWVKTGTALPSRKSLLDRDFYDKNPLLGDMTELADSSRALLFGPKTSKVLNTLMSEAEGALTGSKSADAAMKDAQRQINSAL